MTKSWPSKESDCHPTNLSHSLNLRLSSMKKQMEKEILIFSWVNWRGGRWGTKTTISWSTMSSKYNCSNEALNCCSKNKILNPSFHRSTTSSGMIFWTFYSSSATLLKNLPQQTCHLTTCLQKNDSFFCKPVASYCLVKS